MTGPPPKPSTAQPLLPMRRLSFTCAHGQMFKKPPSTVQLGVIAWERGRPARILSRAGRRAAAELQRDSSGSPPAGGNRISSAEGNPWRRSRLIQVREMTAAAQVCCGRDARAPRKSSSHDITFLTCTRSQAYPCSA